MRDSPASAAASPDPSSVRPWRAALPWLLSIVGASATLGGAVLLLSSVNDLSDSTRAASQLAEIRTFAAEVAVSAERARLQGDGADLEATILAAEQRSAEIGPFVEEVLGPAKATHLLDEMRVAWFQGADTARSYLTAQASYEEVARDAALTGERVDDLLEAVTRQREEQIGGLQQLLRAAIALTLAASAFGVFALIQARRRAALASWRARISEQQVQELRDHDALTGLPTLDKLVRDVQQELDAVGVLDQRRCAALALDFDRFRRINDAFGTAVGDALLVEATRRIAEIVPPARVSRRGGEFLLLLPGIGAQQATLTITRLRAALDAPFEVDGRPVWLTTSMGLAVEEGMEAGVLVARASTAVAHAKAAGGARVHTCDERCARESEERLSLMGDLRSALDRGELDLHYQPQVALDSGRIEAVEALLRWRSPVHGNVPPSVFVPLLEESNQIVHVGAWVIESACRQARSWLDAGRDIRIAVNVSAAQLTEDLPSVIQRVLEDCGVPPGLLEVEITESLAVASDQGVVDTLNAIRGLGVHIALDDFGTGHSSLRHLREIPADSVKIDRVFVAGLTSDAADAAIVSGIVSVAHQLRRRVVAEGVESPAQLAALQRLGCDAVQGYLVGRPVPATELAASPLDLTPAA